MKIKKDHKRKKVVSKAALAPQAAKKNQGHARTGVDFPLHRFMEKMVLFTQSDL